MIWDEQKHVDTVTGICTNLGYVLFLVEREQDIPGVERTFDDCFHYRNEIWHSKSDTDFIPGIWHEAGHAFVAELLNCGIRDRGVHWAVHGEREWNKNKSSSITFTGWAEVTRSEEEDACHATYALMRAFGVPDEDVKNCLAFVSFEAENADPHILKFWERVVSAYMTEGVESARAVFSNINWDPLEV